MQLAQTLPISNQMYYMDWLRGFPSSIMQAACMHWLGDFEAQLQYDAVLCVWHCIRARCSYICSHPTHM